MKDKRILNLTAKGTAGNSFPFSLKLTLLRYCAVEHEVLEREIARLRALYQQQQQQQQPSNSHRRTKSRDLDSQFANLSLKQKDSSSGCDPISGPLH